MSNKIERSITGPLDIDINYMDSYSILIICSSDSIAVFECNIDLFKQLGMTCSDQVNSPICLNPA